MKTPLLAGLALLALITPLARAAESKRTAEYIIANSAESEGQEITLDVAFVKPAQWKSPVGSLAFFQAMTIDRRDHKAGGHILVAIPSENASAFAKKYGMDFDGRNDSDPLRGTLLAAPGRDGRARIWLLDTTGQAADLIRDRKLTVMEDEGARGERPWRKGDKAPLRR